ncbi:MAG TPA: hypothetical protein VD908_10900 [Cytophagales bacterium]|nr:hypothetical protein [Cytophagales bacterium]
MHAKEVQPTDVIYYSQITTLNKLNNILALRVDEKLKKEASKQQIKILGPIQWNYYGTDGNPDTAFTLEIVFPVDRPGRDDEFKFKTLPSFKCISVIHKGSWLSIKDVYDNVIPQMHVEGLSLTGNCREIYSKIVGPASEENITEVQVEYK